MWASQKETCRCETARILWNTECVRLREKEREPIINSQKMGRGGSHHTEPDLTAEPRWYHEEKSFIHSQPKSGHSFKSSLIYLIGNEGSGSFPSPYHILKLIFKYIFVGYIFNQSMPEASVEVCRALAFFKHIKNLNKEGIQIKISHLLLIKTELEDIAYCENYDNRSN